MKTPVPSGFLVAVEGIDGSGKTTLSSAIAQYCGERGLGQVFSKEPTGVHSGVILRNSAHEGRLSLDDELALFNEDRRNHVQRSIAPALRDSFIVVLDRYYWSTAAYQGARGGSPKEIIQINETFAPAPDLVILLDLEPQAGIDRILKRGDQPNAFENVDSMKKIREIFIEMSKSSSNCVVIDASVSLRETVKKGIHLFQEAVMNKIALKHGKSPLGVNSTLEFLGGDPLELTKQFSELTPSPLEHGS